MQEDMRNTGYITIQYFSKKIRREFFIFVAQQPNSGLGHIIVEVSRLHTHTPPVGLLWKRDKPVIKTNSYTTHNRHKRRT
jgi:hypothetical protein